MIIPLPKGGWTSISCSIVLELYFSECRVLLREVASSELFPKLLARMASTRGAFQCAVLGLREIGASTCHAAVQLLAGEPTLPPDPAQCNQTRTHHPLAIQIRAELWVDFWPLMAHAGGSKRGPLSDVLLRSNALGHGPSINESAEGGAGDGAALGTGRTRSEHEYLQLQPASAHRRSLLYWL